MCSLKDVDENDDTLLSVEKPSFKENTTCRSCSNRGLVVLRKKDIYCKDCFLSCETHKFRAALGKSKIMKPQDKVLLAYSGSPASAALLHLLNCGVKEGHHKKLLFNVFVLFIDEGALFNMTITEREGIVQQIKNEEITKYDFPLYITTLSETFNDSPTIDSFLKCNEENDQQLVNLFNSLTSVSSKEDLLYILRQKLILKAAEQLNCNKIFTAEIGTDIAVKLLSMFSLGRGNVASFETGFCDPRHPDIKIIRPLRDFTEKEIVFYNKFNSLATVQLLSLTTKSPANISIRKLTEKFVMNLQEGFPSTVYTIFRTGEKLSSSTSSKDETKNFCVLCKDEIRTHKGRSRHTAVEAADFSRNTSSKKTNNCALKPLNCCGSCPEKKLGINAYELQKYLCYGCVSVVRDMKNLDFLPKEVIQFAVQRRDFNAMKEEISDFLIDSSEVDL